MKSIQVYRKYLFPYAVIALLVSLFVIFTDCRIIPGKGTWNQLELRSIDFRFLFKKKLEKDPIKKIIVIAIDEKSYKKINQPLIFYHTYISEVIDYLVEGGVKTIGLDIELPSISLEDKIEGGYESIYLQSFMNARKKGVNIIIGFSSQENAPLQGYLLAAGEANLATFHLTEDSDDCIRRQQLYFDDGGKRYNSIAYTLAMNFTNQQISAPSKTILIDYSLAQDIPIYSFHDIYELSKKRNNHQGNAF